MLVNLTPGIDGQDGDHFAFAINGKDDAPAAHTRLPQTVTFGQWSAEARIEGVFGQLYSAPSDSSLRRTIQAVEKLLGLVGEADTVVHSPRSRWYSSRDFTRPAGR